MDEILHHLSNHETPLFVGICRGINIPGILGWCRIFVHPQYVWIGTCFGFAAPLPLETKW